MIIIIIFIIYNYDVLIYLNNIYSIVVINIQNSANRRVIILRKYLKNLKKKLLLIQISMEILGNYSNMK